MMRVPHLISMPNPVKRATHIDGTHSDKAASSREERLVEAGVNFVTVSNGGWDNHNNIFSSLPGKLNAFDQTMATLITDLNDRGLLESTLVIAMGEFGRTPVINRNAGRDHHSRVFSIMLAGGGVQGGQVVGASDPLGTEPAETPVRPEDLSATLYKSLGIDYNQHLESPDGVRIVLPSTWR